MINSIVKNLQKLNWSLRHKIALAFALVLVGFVGNGIISIVLLSTINTTSANLNAITEAEKRLDHYKMSFDGEVGIYYNDVFFYKNSYIQDNFKDTIINTLTEANNFKGGHTNFDRIFASYYSQATNDFQKIGDELNSNDFTAALNTEEQATALFNQIDNVLYNETNKLSQDQINANNTFGQLTLISGVVLVTMTALSVLLVLLLLFLTERVLVQPLNRLRQALQKVSNGELNQQLDIANKDEVGELAQSFQLAINSLQKVISGVQISESLQAVTSQLAAISQEQSDGSNEQVVALAEVLTSMQELGSTANNIAQNASQVADLTISTLAQIEQVSGSAQNSQEYAHEMSLVVENTLKAIENFGEQVTELSELMLELGQHSRSIGQIVTALSSITNDVHLLSLNASIEAAGAGVYGERFRVVAREIKQLANRASQATEQAQQLVRQVQSSTDIAANKVSDGHEQLASIIVANDSLRDILQKVEESAYEVSGTIVSLVMLAAQVRERTEEIRQATQLQTMSSSQVITSAHQVEEVAVQTASATHQIASSSLELENLSNQLNNILGQVHLAA